MAVMMCAGAAGCDRMISVSLIPGGNEVAKADPDGYASEWSCCAGCKSFTCDRCLPKQGGRCRCGAPVRLFSEAERMQVARNLAARLPPLATATSGKTLYPLIKPADYPHRALVVSLPLPIASGGPTRADLPIVTLAENTPNGYVVLTKDDPVAKAGGDLLQPAIDRLLQIPRDLVIMQGGIAVHAGQDLAAELLLHEAWLRDVVGKQLGTNELWVVVPHRVAFYAVPKNAPLAQLSMFSAIVRTELERGRLGHAPVSDLAFHLRDGKIVDAVPYTLLAARGGGPGGSGGGQARKQVGASGGGNWLAGFMGAFFGGVIGMGMGIGVISGLDSLVPTGMDGTVVLGLAAMIGGLGFLLGFRSNLR